MIARHWRSGALVSALIPLFACTPADTPRDELPFEPDYQGIETRLLDDDLVAFDLKMVGARDALDLRGYGDCAVAQYALIRGYGYARHLRTTTERSGDLWLADAIYTISRDRPAGLEIIVAEDRIAQCQTEEIPTV